MVGESGSPKENQGAAMRRREWGEMDSGRVQTTFGR